MASFKMTDDISRYLVALKKCFYKQNIPEKMQVTPASSMILRLAKNVIVVATNIGTVSAGGRSARPTKLGVHPIWRR